LPGIAWRPDTRATQAAVAAPSDAVAPVPAASAGIVAPPVTSPPLALPTSPRVTAPPTPATSPPASPVDLSPPAPADEPTDEVSPGLTVVDAGYAASSAGTPLATVGVPSGSVAVALRANQADKIAYVRLAGAGTTLSLLLDQSGANLLDALAGLLLCPVVEESWNLGAGEKLPADAPAYDCAAAIVATRSPSGDRWTFDMSSVTDPARSAGFAIVPDATAAAPTFQVVLRPEAPEEDP
jgi:hypothetical protein